MIKINRKELAHNLTEAYKDTGIVAFSNCCGNCKSNYADSDKFQNSEVRQNIKGIHFFKFFLDGMNFEKDVNGVWCHYEDFDYLMENKDQEVKVINDWCELVGVEVGTIKLPENVHQAIYVEFKDEVRLI